MIEVSLENLKEKLLAVKEKKEKRELPNNVIDITPKLKNKNANNNKDFKFKIDTNIIKIIALVSVIIIAVSWVLLHKNAYAIYVGDIKIGSIKEKGLEESIQDTAISQIEEIEGTKIKLKDEYKVHSVHTRESKKNIFTPDYVISQVKNNLAYTVQAIAMSVDGNEIGVLKNQQQIDETTQKIVDSYKLEDAQIVEVGFVEEVNYNNKFIEKNELMTNDQLYQKLTETVNVPKVYEVKSGDSLWSIASNNGVTITDILKVNTNLTENSVLKIGQQINLSVPKPFLSVKVITETKHTETIPYETQYQTDDTQYKTYKSIIQEGKNGEQEITTHVTYINGYKEDEEIVGEPVVITPPTSAIIVTGTKATPPKSATGSFGRPISGGTISSYFGPRWGSTHVALDIAAPRGTTIYASDGGTVTKAASSGSYGNLVVINHGNGFETYYGHCSSIYVKVGQKVGKGEKIAAVGATGNATGNHVHFEIRKNGKPVNPLNYIS